MSASREQEQEQTGLASPSALTSESTAGEGRSVIFTIRAKPGQEEALADWAHRIVATARAHEGNLAAAVIGTPQGSEYRVFHHFQSAQSLQSWLDSNERQQLLADAESLLESAPTNFIGRLRFARLRCRCSY
jgi:uncharacterized protein